MAKVKKDPQTEIKNKKICIFSFFKSIVDTKFFSNKIDMKSLYIYLGISFLILVFLTLIKSYLVNTIDSIFLNLIYIVVGIPLIFIGFYSLFYIFLNSFESKRKPFLESFLVFIAIVLPFIILGNLLNLIDSLIINITISYFVGLLIIANILYLVINLLISFKNYYSTSIFRIITSLILVEVFIGIFAVIQYLSVIIGSL